MFSLAPVSEPDRARSRPSGAVAGTRPSRRLAAGRHAMRPTIPGWARTYGFAIASVSVCALVRWLLNPLLESHGLYLAFMIPVAASSYVGGAGPGALSTLLSAAIVNPVRAPLTASDAGPGTAHLVLFVSEAAAVILLMRALQRSEDTARQALAAAEAARARAEAADNAKDQFVARLSHEWRAPLDTISGWLWQLEHFAIDPELVTRAAVGMRRAVDTQSRLVSDLLDYARASHGKLSLDCEETPISEPVKHAVEAISAEAHRKRLMVRVVDESLDACVWGDAMRLEQVFTNLLQNASKFTPSGGIVAITLARRDEQVEVTVTDTGVGIPPDALPRIFRPFSQTDVRRDARRGGLGLGLSIAHEIIDRHGGQLTATSPGPGGGSSFCVRLPLAVITRQRQQELEATL